MNNIAIIPARGGSKRIKNKNIKLFFGKPIIQRTYEILKKSKLFSEIIVSTESSKIKKVCEKFGVKSFIQRPKKLSGDNVGIKYVMQHAIVTLDRKIQFDNTCCVFPCSPFLKISNLKIALKLIAKKKNLVVHPVTKFRHPPERSLIMKNNFLKPTNRSNQDKMTQVFRQQFHDLGQFYFCHKNYWFMKSNKSKGIGIPLPIWETVDIDEMEDWKFAEYLFKLKNNNKLLKM